MSQVWVGLMWALLALIDDLWLTLTLLSFHSFYIHQIQGFTSNWELCLCKVERELWQWGGDHSQAKPTSACDISVLPPLGKCWHQLNGEYWILASCLVTRTNFHQLSLVFNHGVTFQLSMFLLWTEVFRKSLSIVQRKHVGLTMTVPLSWVL